MNDNRIMVSNGNVVGAESISGDSVDHPNFSNNKHYVGWPIWEENVAELCHRLSKDEWLFVYGIPRGGVTLSTMISHRLGIPMVSEPPKNWMLDWYHWRMRQNIDLENTCKNILIADSICDTGKTIDYIQKEIHSNPSLSGDHPQKEYTFKISVVDVDPKVVDIVDYHVNIKDPKQWLVYPWEHGSQELKKL